MRAGDLRVLREMRTAIDKFKDAADAQGGDEARRTAEVTAYDIDPADVNYVPYSGGGEAATALLGNQVVTSTNGLLRRTSRRGLT